MMTDLELFDKLKADITLFVAPTLDLTVQDPGSSTEAIEVAKRVKAFIKQVDDKRKELVGPLNERVKLINDYAKTIMAPLQEAESHVKSELNAYAAKQEEIRQAELRRLDEERRERERKLQEERERAEAELMAKQVEEAELAAEANAFFGTGETPVAEVNAQIDEKLTREWAEKQAELDRQAMMAQVEHKQKVYDASLDQIRNTRKTWKCELVDINAVPKEFLIMQLNTAMVLAAARAGRTDIPGVRLYQEVSVAIGSKTYMPKVRG